MYIVVGAGVRERSLCDGCSRATLPQLCVQLERRENAQYCAPVRVDIVCCLDRVSVQCTKLHLGVCKSYSEVYVYTSHVCVPCLSLSPSMFQTHHENGFGGAGQQ